jgi:hypothetical protein
MNQQKLLSPLPVAAQFRMRPQLQKLQIAFSIVLILFSLFMIMVLFRRQETSPLEYLLWVSSIVVWCYAIWYASSARLTLTSKNIEYRAGFIHLQAEWNHINSLGMEPSGPVIYVQESNQKQSSNQQTGRRNRGKKLPLYLFMTQWKTQEDWQNDPVGKEIIARADWLIKPKQ